MSNKGTIVKQDQINVYVFAKCSHECDKNTQRNALRTFRAHARVIRCIYAEGTRTDLTPRDITQRAPHRVQMDCDKQTVRTLQVQGGAETIRRLIT
jgi:hypothetical protein